MPSSPNPVLIYYDSGRRFGIPTKQVRTLKPGPGVLHAPAVTTTGGA